MVMLAIKLKIHKSPQMGSYGIIKILIVHQYQKYEMPDFILLILCDKYKNGGFVYE